MHQGFSGSMTMAALAAAAILSVSMVPTAAQAQAPSAAASAPGVKTTWGDPDLQGIWTDEFDTPFQRPAKLANQDYFTEPQREELDKARSSVLSNDERQERGSELDVAGGYNGVFLTVKRTS